MKRNNTCPKCGSPDLLRIPTLPGESSRIAVGDLGMHAVAVSQYVCGACGYIERWVDDVADLDELRKEYGTNG
jgi:ribosomal protein S27AE